MSGFLRARLPRLEIDLLKHLAKFSPTGVPIAVSRKYQDALAPLWRRSLIDVWYRQNRAPAGGRTSQFISITVDGARRIDAILSAQTKREHKRDD